MLVVISKQERKALSGTQLQRCYLLGLGLAVLRLELEQLQDM